MSDFSIVCNLGLLILCRFLFSFIGIGLSEGGVVGCGLCDGGGGVILFWCSLICEIVL